MLTPMEPPVEIEQLYNDNKIPLTQFAGIITSNFVKESIDNQTNVCVRYPGAVIYVRSGIFKCFYGTRLVRYFSTGDLFLTLAQPLDSLRIICEFGAEIMIISREELFHKMQSDDALLEQWLTFQSRSEALGYALCSLYIQDDAVPGGDLRQFDAGMVIIREGDPPDMLYEMLEGSAQVTAGGAVIGEVHEDEIFGEVSFLTGEKRGATVTATTQCLVQVINRPDLEKISRFRPTLMYRLAQTLATRLTEANKRLVKGAF